jgi:hypothetical protein
VHWCLVHQRDYSYYTLTAAVTVNTKQVYLVAGLNVLEGIPEYPMGNEQRDKLEFELCMAGCQVTTNTYYYY